MTSRAVEMDTGSTPALSHGTGVIWDFDPNLTSEIYEDLGVQELAEMEEKQEMRNEDLGQNEMKRAAKKAEAGQGKIPVIHTTPSPAAMRASARSHIHDGQNCSCKRRILGYNDHPDSFSYLSDEVILAIFKWLSKKTLTDCAKVNRRWRRLAYDDELWRKVDLSTHNFQPGILGMILQRGVTVAKLSRSTINRPVFSADDEGSAMEEDGSPQTVMISPPSNPNHLGLESLDLSACISDDAANIQAILERCPALKRLSLESCTVNEGAMLALAKSCSSLQLLNLAMCHLDNDASLASLLENAQQLTSLNMSWMNISSATLYQFIPTLSPSLQHLNISGYREKLKDQDVITMVTRCRCLQDLDLSDSTALTNESIAGIVQNLRTLKHLSLSRCYDISHYAYVSLVDIPTFRALDIFGVLQPRQLERLGAQLPKIEINSFPFSAISRPTFSSKQPHAIWGEECEA